jgi:hypothetical protein
MSTRLVLNGRTAFATRDWWAQQRRDKRDKRTMEAERELAKTLEEHPPDPLPPPRRVPGQPIRDLAEGVTYRHTTVALLPADGWVTAQTVMGWYGVTYQRVVDWVRAGLLDAAIARGSSTKRYRVLDAAACERDAAPGGPPTLAPPVRKGRRVRTT